MTILSRDAGLVEAALSAANTFSDGLYTDDAFNFSIEGTWVGTITAQRSLDLGVTWRDVDTFTTNIETYGFDPGQRLHTVLVSKQVNTLAALPMFV